MKKSILSIIAGLFAFTCIHAQKPVALEALSFFQERDAVSFRLFTPSGPAGRSMSSFVSGAQSLSLDQDMLQQLRREQPEIFRLELPGQPGLDLYKVEVFNDQASVMTSDGNSIPVNPDHHFYRGMVHGDINSLAVVSIFENRIQILYADAHGNKRIQKTVEGDYIAFEDENILINKQLECYTTDAHADLSQKETQGANRSMPGNCVQVYVECDYHSYQQNGSSVANTEEWVAELWNEVITLYANESIPVQVSDIFVHTASFSPYDSQNSTSGLLNALVTRMGTLNYDGRLAHLMSTRSLGGGIAYVDVLCSSTLMCAVSASLSTNIVQFPTYSWNVEVVTHEMGHNMGSSHTHKCVWNGNNTQIDDCGNQYAANSGQSPEGSACYNSNAPILPVSGTIMSYCHLISGVGINFNNGFGTQPGNLIRNRYNNANCNTGTCSPPGCVSLISPVAGSINADVSSNLTWSAAPGAEGYRLTIGLTPNGGEILNNADVGLITTYDPANIFPFNVTLYVKIVPYNVQGDAQCANQTFVTEPNTQPLCTSMIFPLPGATQVPLNAVIHWANAVGNQLGYKITIGTTPNGGEIANQLNVGNVNSYDPPGYLPHSVPVYVRITPYGSNGDVQGCITQSFTTLVPPGGDFCNTAINLPCDGVISGNTTTSYPDPEAFSCGVPIEAPGIWYKFIGNGQNTIITTCTQAGYDTQLNAYSGGCGSFTCITGNDDFCVTKSRITFPTVNGTTYYILVQGWGGGVGSFTISRTCYSGPFYCQSGGRVATQEWIKTFSLSTYTKQSGSSHYSDYTNETISLSRGGTYNFSVSPQFAQGAQSETFRIWIDYNRDGDFADSGEQLWTASGTSTVSGSFTIPVTTATGTTRMRVSMERGSTPSSCEIINYGEVEDYIIDIRCNMVTSTVDAGNGSLRNVSMCADDYEPILFAPALNNSTINISEGQITADGHWRWMAGNNTNITIQAQGITPRVLLVGSGRSVEIQNLKIIGGANQNGSAVDNSGILKLRNTDLKRATGTTSIPLRNSGTIFIEGSCDIMQ